MSQLRSSNPGSIYSTYGSGSAWTSSAASERYERIRSTDNYSDDYYYSYSDDEPEPPRIKNNAINFRSRSQQIYPSAKFNQDFSDDYNYYSDDEKYPGVEVDNDTKSLGKNIQIPSRQSLRIVPKEISIPVQVNKPIRARSQSIDFIPNQGFPVPPRSRTPLNISIPVNNSSSMSPLQQTPNLPPKSQRIIRSASSFDPSAVPNSILTRPIQLTQIPSEEDLEAETQNNEIDTSILLQQQLSDITKFLENPVAMPSQKQATKSKLSTKPGKLTLDFSTRYEKTGDHEILTQQPLKPLNSNVRTALALPRSQLPFKPQELREKEYQLSRPGLSVDFSNSSGLQVRTASNPNLISNTQNTMEIELPGGKEAVELKWNQSAPAPKKHLKKYKGVLQTSLSISKPGMNATGEFYDTDELEDTLQAMKGPIVERPKGLEDGYIHEVTEKDEDGKEKSTKYIMIPTAAEKNPKNPIQITRANPHTANQIIVQKNYYPVALLRELKKGITNVNRFSSISILQKSPGFKMLQLLHHEMLYPEVYAEQKVEAEKAKPTEVITPQMRLAEQREKKKQMMAELERQRKEQEQARLAKLTNNEQVDVFMPTKIMKKFGQWDENSEEAFKFNLKQAFNKLTIMTIEQTDAEVCNLLTTDERITLAVEQFTTKAINEQSFANIYAKFTAQCSNAKFREVCVREIITKFFECIANPGKEEKESDSNNCCSTAAFFGNLLAENAMAEANGHTAIGALFDTLEKTPIHSTHIEMLHTFVQAAGAGFICKVNQQLWKRLDKTSQSKDLKSRYQFMLTEIIEMKNKYIKDGIQNLGELEIKEIKEDTINTVRAAYEDYKNNEFEIPIITTEAPDFLQAALQLLIDYPSEIFTYLRFITDVMKDKKAYADDVLEIVKHQMEEFKENKVIDDFRGLWVAISDLAVMLMLNGIIAYAEASEIHSLITDDVWDCINDIKWWLFDNWDFSEPLQAPGVRDDEIALVVKMPKILNDTKVTVTHMSRMICIAVIRTIFTRQEKNKLPSLSMVPKHFRELLSICLKKQEQTTLDEIDALLHITRFFDFTVEDFIKAFK